MFTVKSLRLNKFRRIYIRKNSEYFARYGFRQCGDNFSSNGQTTDPISLSASKLDSIVNGEREILSSYHSNLKENQMPLDTDTGIDTGSNSDVGDS